jgi:hypothetical protein
VTINASVYPIKSQGIAIEEKMLPGDDRVPGPYTGGKIASDIIGKGICSPIYAPRDTLLSGQPLFAQMPLRLNGEGRGGYIAPFSGPIASYSSRRMAGFG